MNTNKKTILVHDQLGRLEFDGSGVAETTLTLAGVSIAVDVNFEGEPTNAALDGPARLAADIVAQDRNARQAMAQDLAQGEEGEALDLYKSHHVEEIGEVLSQRFGVDGPAGITDAIFLAGLQLARVGLFPGDSDAALVCDYTLGAELTDYLIVVSFDAEGEVSGIAMES